MVVVGDVVDGVGVWVSTTMVDESDVVGGSGAELGGLGLASLMGRLVEVDVGIDAVLSVLEEVGDEDTVMSVGSIVKLAGGVSSPGTWNGEPVPSQYKLRALGPPQTCDASPVHAMLQ